MAVQHVEDSPPFMRALHLETIHTFEFPEYANMASGYATNCELYVGMQFNDRETVVRAFKTYNISRSMDYKLYESEPMTFDCKCKHFGSGCQWLVNVNFKKEQG